MKKITEKANKLVTKKNILIVTIIALIVFLLPIIILSFYTYPIADDFNYGTFTIGTLQSSGIIELIAGAFKNVYYTYNVWQGTYSAVILFSLSPIVLGTKMYFITTFTMVGFLFIGMYYFLKQIVTKLIKLDKTTFLIILLLSFISCIEILYSIVEGLYWWNGSSYYIIFFSLELIEMGLLVKQYYLNEKKKKHFVYMSALAIIIAGGNFITALQQIIVLFFTTAYLFVLKKEKNKSRETAVLFIIALVGLIISAVAPGNAVRQSALQGMTAPSAIIHSFFECTKTLFEWMNPFTIIMIVIIEFFLYDSYYKNTLRFDYPLIFIIFMYCILSAEFTPGLYAQSAVGGGRLLNTIYFSYFFFTLFSIYYVIGYIRAKLIERKIFAKDAYNNIKMLIKENGACLFIIVIILLLIVSYKSRQTLTTYQVLHTIRSKEAEVYSYEWHNRYISLYDKKQKYLEWNPLTFCPETICMSDLSEDKDNWLNTPMAEIYDKEYIVIKSNNNK